jgi:hypothetical protein
MDENTSSSEAHEISPQQDHTLPILKKIIDLSTKAQVNYGCWFICLTMNQNLSDYYF